MLLQSHVDGSGPLDVSASDGVLGEGSVLRDQYIYLKTEHSSTGGQEQEAYNQFARSVISSHCLTCYLHVCLVESNLKSPKLQL